MEGRDLDQWFFTITDYADELLEALSDLEGWPANVREMQRNWIGRQEGASVTFEVPGRGEVDIFTTRLDTIHGATFFALSPAHELAREIAAENDDVAAYVERVEAAGEDEIPQTSGVFTGEFAVNPATGEEIPVYVADYVLKDLGTGALYAVPAHDERDHAFAVEHGSTSPRSLPLPKTPSNTVRRALGRFRSRRRRRARRRNTAGRRDRSSRLEAPHPGGRPRGRGGRGRRRRRHEPGRPARAR